VDKLKSTDKQVNARLLKTYGITLAEYNKMLVEQGGGCAICGRPPGTKRLHVDHDHSISKIKLDTVRSGKGWMSSTEYRGGLYAMWGRGKSEAVKGLRAKLKRASVRGILDWPCNSGLQKWRDNPNLLEKAAAYIRKFNAKEAA
jgi:hypothetical protein